MSMVASWFRFSQVLKKFLFDYLSNASLDVNAILFVEVKSLSVKESQNLL